MARRTAQQLSVDELRTQISQRLKSSATFSKTVYKDQPIIMTGSQLKSFVPDPIREARSLARKLYSQGRSVVDVFFEQARLLAGYTDDFEFTGEFSQYFPTYEDMGNEQLRGYFSWRTKVREGVIEKTSLSFAYVYLYELINLIGVRSAQEGYEAMRSFGDSYRRFDEHFGKLFDAWLDDLVIYYSLDPGLLRMGSFAENDAAFTVLASREDRTRKEIFDALCRLGSYKMEESPFFIEHEAELVQLVTSTYLKAAQHHDAKLKNTLAEKLVGRMGKERVFLFQRAVFADPLKIERAEYEISPIDTVYCRDGAWFRTRYTNLEHPLLWVTQLLETCECSLRDAYEYPNTLERTLTTKYLLKHVDAVAKDMVEDAKMRAEREVKIDFSKLDHIRTAANETCEKLIVEEESQPLPLEHDAMLERNGFAEKPDSMALYKDEGNSIAGEHKDKQGRQDGAWGRMHKASSARTESASGAFARAQDCLSDCAVPMRHIESRDSSLSPDESALLAHLLAGGSVREFEREHACIASVLIDSINEKLYDEFADICIDTCGDEPVIIEDYATELRALVGAE